MSLSGQEKKYLLHFVREDLQQTRDTINHIQEDLARLDKTAYNDDPSQEKLYNMNADQYEAKLNTELNNAQTRRNQLVNIRDFIQALP